MTLELVAIRLQLNTSLGRAEYATRFGPGLNVLNADNSWGKSTLLQSIVYALGLEGALSASRRSPLGPAMTQAIDTPKGRATVIESSVILWIRNARGQHIRAQRWVMSQDVDARLIRVWIAESEKGLEAAKHQDFFVRDPGSTTSTLGFHRLLEEFLGWNLPTVPNFEGGETRLYLEVLLPLFYVEQKFGWSGVAPRVPTHYRIREPLRRGMEFTLGLHTLDQLRRREALREEESSIRSAWGQSVSRAIEAAASENLRLVMMDETPVTDAQRRRGHIEYFDGSRWLPIEGAIERWAERLDVLVTGTTTAGDRTERTRTELASAERAVARAGAIVRASEENLALSQADHDALLDRLASVAADRSRLIDIRKIHALGGELALPLIAEGRCPTCSQDLDGRAVATGQVASLEDNIALVDSERTTLQNLIAAARESQQALQSQYEAGQAQLQNARTRVRSMRDELVGASNAPSITEVQERLILASHLRGAERVQATVAEVEEELSERAEQLDDLRRRLAALNAEPEVASDAETLRNFESRFQDQLRVYGLRSLDASDVAIDDRTLLPVSDGFELRANTIFASSEWLKRIQRGNG